MWGGFLIRKLESFSVNIYMYKENTVCHYVYMSAIVSHGLERTQRITPMSEYFINFIH